MAEKAVENTRQRDKNAKKVDDNMEHNRKIFEILAKYILLQSGTSMV